MKTNFTISIKNYDDRKQLGESAAQKPQNTKQNKKYIGDDDDDDDAGRDERRRSINLLPDRRQLLLICVEGGVERGIEVCTRQAGLAWLAVFSSQRIGLAMRLGLRLDQAWLEA